MEVSVPRGDGLRDRKKRRTRQSISDMATQLFVERGFEEVTLAQIADAAEVSVKTIFNHFGSKDDLYFDRFDELRASIVAVIVERPAGTTVLAALEALLTDNRVPFPGDGWGGLRDQERYESFRSFLAAQERSPALRSRRLVLEEELGEFLLGVLATELDRQPQDPALLALGAMLVAAMQLRERTLRAAILARMPAGEVHRRVRAVVGATFGPLRVGFGALDRAR